MLNNPVLLMSRNLSGMGLFPVEQEKATYYCLNCDHEWEQWANCPEQPMMAQRKERTMEVYKQRAWNTRIMESRNLTELCNNLNALEEVLDTRFYDTGTRERTEDFIDTTSLPVFGPEPSDTYGIFSWDETRYMIPSEVLGPKWVLVSRDEDDGPLD